MPVRLGISPIGWSNDDLPELGGDIPLDTFTQQQTADVRGAAEKAAKPWIDAIKEAREQRS